MDAITHLLSGALVARATFRKDRSSTALTLAERTLAGSLAAIAPDIDYAVYFFDLLSYLNWHRGITHSLVFMPVGALLLAFALAWLFGRIRHRFYRWQDLYEVCLLGIAVHIAGDTLTPYGTLLFFPLTDTKYSSYTTFVIDPWFTGIILCALLLSLKWPRRSARWGFFVLGCYLGLQAVLHQQARGLAREYATNAGLTGYQIFVLPQPLSPLNWKLMVVDGDLYHTALIALGSWKSGAVMKTNTGVLARLAAAYQPPGEHGWRIRQRFGSDVGTRLMAQDAWRHGAMAEVRHFTLFPALFRIQGEGPGMCLWFTDLRFVLPELDPPFQFRICKSQHVNDWGQVGVTRNLAIRNPAERACGRIGMALDDYLCRE